MACRLARSIALDRLVERLCSGMDLEDDDEGAPLPTARRAPGRPAALTDEQRTQVRESTEPVAVLVERFNVSRATIYRLRASQNSVTRREF